MKERGVNVQLDIYGEHPVIVSEQPLTGEVTAFIQRWLALFVIEAKQTGASPKSALVELTADDPEDDGR